MHSALGMILGSHFNPLHLPLAAYFRASSLRTDVVAAALSPTDISTADWTPSGLTSRTATQMTVANAGLNHMIMASRATMGVAANHPFVLRFDAAAGSLSGLGFTDDATFTDKVKCDDGTVISNDAGTVVTPLGAVGGGYYRFSCAIPALSLGATLGFRALAPGTNVTAWTATGGETISVTNVVVSQTQVSSLGSIAGQVVSLAQATAENRPQVQWYNGTIYTPVNMDGVAGWRAEIVCDGVNDKMSSGAIAGLTQPYTMFFRGREVVVSHVSVILDGIVAGAATRSTVYYDTTNGRLHLYAGADCYCAWSAANMAAEHTYAIEVNNAAPKMFIDGAPQSVTGTCGTGVIGGLSICDNANGGNQANVAFNEAAVCTRALTLAEHAALARWENAVNP